MELENEWQKPFGGGGSCFKVYATTLEGVALLKLLQGPVFVFSSNLIEFLEKRLPFRRVARMGGGRESKAMAKGVEFPKAMAKWIEFPGWNLTHTLRAQ